MPSALTPETNTHSSYQVKLQKEVKSSNLPEFLLLKLLPLPYHHSQFWAATLDFFLHWPHLFLQLGCFCADTHLRMQQHDDKLCFRGRAAQAVGYDVHM